MIAVRNTHDELDVRIEVGCALEKVSMISASEWAETAAERELLTERTQRCIEMSKRLAQTDATDSIYAREFRTLTGLLLALPQSAELDHMRLRSALRIAETVLTIQEELCVERLKQTETAQ